MSVFTVVARIRRSLLRICSRFSIGGHPHQFSLDYYLLFPNKSILDGEERLSLIAANSESSGQSELDKASDASEIDQNADIRRKQETDAAILQGKIETNDFDVFLAHNSQDKYQVEAIANALRQRGLNPWIDQEQIAPGQWVQDAIQDTIVSQVKSAAIFIGSSGIGKWQALELRSFIQQCAEGELAVIPVLLP
jgi:hypothetical protein